MDGEREADGTTRIDDAVLETLAAGEQLVLAAWLRLQGVEPHRRGMAPRNWVPVETPEPGWALAAPLAPGIKPVYLLPPVPGVSRPNDAPGEAYPITESQAAYAARRRRERAARLARGEPEPETRHHRHHRRLQEEALAQEAAQRLGAAGRAWREAHGLTQTALAGQLGMPRPNVARLEAGELFPGVPVMQRLARVMGGAVRLDVRPDGVTVQLGAETEAA